MYNYQTILALLLVFVLIFGCAGRVASDNNADVVGDHNQTSIKTYTCLDGTQYNFCSSNKPKYCVDGNLIDKASVCGCPDKYTRIDEGCIPEDKTTQLVYRVIDGDTIELQSGERIRLIGINAPESGQKCYAEATSKLRYLVEAKEVRLEKDVTDKDQYGRLLRYVFVDGSFVNLLLVREGYANAYIVSPDVRYSTNITQAEELAKQENGCLWQRAINYSDCINISNFHYDAAGNDNDNLNDEYVTFRNNCDFPINMTGWTVKDAATHIYYFQNFALNPQAYVTLYTGAGSDSSTRLYWGMRDQAVWNNPGDTLYLRDSEGKLVLIYSYGS